LALAQSADPTRPPAAWLTPSDSAVPGQADAGAMRLQSVKMPQRGKPVAVIGGKTVVLGEQIGEARLIRLNEREAVLQGPDGVTHLYLTPEVEKQMIVKPQSRQTGKTGHMKDVP
jgi:MSHA biogenesis protein MshK